MDRHHKTLEDFCGKPKSFFEKNPAISKTISLIILAIFFITLEYLYKLSDNKIFQKILKEEKLSKTSFLKVQMQKLDKFGIN
jgi:hypothetical protein